MKVLFTSLEGSHFQLLVPLAWALRTGGHEVRAVCKPELADTVTQAGITAVPIESPPWQSVLTPFHHAALAYCNEVETTLFERGHWSWETLLAYESIVVPALWSPLNHDLFIDGLVGYARGWQPNLVVWETFCMAGSLAAVAVGAAHARLVAGPDLALQMRPRRAFVEQSARLAPEDREDATMEWLGRHLERLGCSRPADESMLTGQWTIDTRPASQRDDLGLETVPVRYVPYNGRCVVPAWLAEPTRRPRICLTLGVSITSDYAMFDLERTLAVALTTLAGMDVQVVAAISAEQRVQLPEMPENVRIVDFVPLHDLLPSCDLIVHHGGYQTKATAELHAVPQLIITGWEWVSEGMGEEYEKTSALLSIAIRSFTAEIFREKLLQLLTDSSFTERARRLQQEVLAMQPPNAIVPVLEELTVRHRTAAPSPDQEGTTI